jgi:hypothetical protein
MECFLRAVRLELYSPAAELSARYCRIELHGPIQVNERVREILIDTIQFRPLKKKRRVRGRPRDLRREEIDSIVNIAMRKCGRRGQSQCHGQENCFCQGDHGRADDTANVIARQEQGT